MCVCVWGGGGGGTTSNNIKNDLVAHAIFTGTVFSQGCKQRFVKLKDSMRVSFIKF